IPTGCRTPPRLLSCKQMIPTGQTADCRQSNQSNQSNQSIDSSIHPVYSVRLAKPINPSI
ncbi:MAG: hypothetical protein WCU80_09245, partial [Paludibacteraceae bacterium]